MRTTRRFAALIFTLTLSLAPARAFAWNNCGHMLVAEIAYQELLRNNPELLAKIIATLKKHPRLEDLEAEIAAHHITEDAHDHYLFLIAATWPDLVKQSGRKNPEHGGGRFDPEDHREWHYVDLPYDQDGKEHAAEKFDESPWKPGSRAEPRNCEQALDKCEAELRDADASDAAKAKALCWVEHLIGDIHQPLHCATMYSATMPEEAPFEKGDKGGNLFFLEEKSSHGHLRKELHAYWDDVLGKSMSLSHLHQYARHLIAIHARKELKKELAESSERDWAHASHALAVQYAYLNGKLTPNHEPGEEYFYAAQKVAETQVALGGYRLADKLAAAMK